MKKIFWGSLFVFFSINLSVGSGTLGLLPDFVGYILMIQGAKELKTRTPETFSVLRLAEIVWKVLCVATVVTYTLELFGISLAVDSAEGILCSALLAAGECYCWKMLIESFGRMEQEHQCDLNTLHLTTAWWIYVISAVLNVGVVFVTNATLFSIILGLTITAPIYFIVQLYKANKAYQQGGL